MTENGLLDYPLSKVADVISENGWIVALVRRSFVLTQDEATKLDAAWDAARGLSSRDLLGGKYTQAQYDLLTKPWREVIGKVHPG